MAAPDPLTTDQLALLRWIGDGCPNGVWSGHRHKLAMPALQMRGLAMRASGRGWRAVLTPTGRHYLEHGTFPPEAASDPAHQPATPPPPRGKPRHRPVHTAPAGPDLAAPPNTDEREAASTTATGNPVERTTIASQIRRPHPAIRELIENPRRIDLDAALRRRAHLLAHSLVQEALRRGWTVTSNIGKIEAPLYGYGRPERRWSSANLFEIDADHKPLGIQFRARTTRSRHVETPAEAGQRAAGRGWGIPTYDYMPSDTLRLFLYSDTRKQHTFEDTTRRRLEDRLDDILGVIEQATRSELARREAERRRQDEAMRRLEEERRQQARVDRYDQWLTRLTALPEAIRDHDELAGFVGQLTDRLGNPDSADSGLAQLLAWAQQHLRESDPIDTFRLGAAEQPDMTFDEYRRWKRQLSQTRPWNR